MTSMPEPSNSAARLARAVRRTLHLPDGASVLPPLAALACAGAALCGAYAWAAGWLTPSRLTPERYISGFEADFGAHPGFRHNHAKGICVIGHFDGNGAGSAWSSAGVFEAVRTPVIGRFAVPGGNPSIADTSTPVRSLALQFSLPNGEQWRTGMNSTPVFLVNSPQGFYDNLQASRLDPATGKPDPARIKAFFESHPETAAFRSWVKAHPPASSFINTGFYSINAFELVDANGNRHLARWSMQPDAAYAPVSPASAADHNALQDDLLTRLAQGSARWHLQLQLANPGDPSNDATRAWPADRRTVDAGTLTLEKAVEEGDGPCRDVNFDPTVLPRGIALSDDPLLAARSGVYARSYKVRTAEQAAFHQTGAAQ